MRESRLLSLRSLRMAAGLSQVQLAERAGVTQKTISLIERGQRTAPHPSTRRRIADALGVGVLEIREFANGNGQGSP